MPRKKTGCVQPLGDGRYQIVLTLNDGRRKKLPVDPSLNLREARTEAKRLARKAARLNVQSGDRDSLTTSPASELLASYVDRVFEMKWTPSFGPLPRLVKVEPAPV